MKFARRYTNRLESGAEPAHTIVVVDVLRSFTTAAVAFSRGARRIYPVAGSVLPASWVDRQDCVSVGSLPGGDPAPGFDFGNSPSSLWELDLSGKDLVLSTAAGVAGLLRFRQAPRLYVTSLACARATAEAIRASGAPEVCFVITGEWVDRDGDEDAACADYIEALLRGRAASAADYERRVRESDFGKRFGARRHPHLPKADLELCAQADLYPFAMPVRRDGDMLVIVAETC